MRTLMVAVLGVAGASALGAQSLTSRVNQSDGPVQIIYPSRSGVCGDGLTFISNVLGRSRYFTSGGSYSARRSDPDPRCEHGPARVVATIVGGQPTRLHAYVGPVPSSTIRTITASAAEASGWLEQIMKTGSTRLSEDAALPLILADSTDPWPALLTVARNEQRPQSLRRNALMWVSAGVNEHLGIDDATADTDDDALRKEAVFVLSQRAKREGTAELMELARMSKRPAVRRDAIFWLSQTGEIGPVADLYAELLGGR